MGGSDKGLVPLNGRPLIAYVIDALAAQVGALMINANRRLNEYARLGYPVITDRSPDFQGPLAGMLSGLVHASTRWILTAPCDAPLLPADYAQRMWSACTRDGAPACVAHDGGRLQPMFVLLSRELLTDLEGALESGQRRADTWIERHAPVIVDMSDSKEAFCNVNTLEDIEQIEQHLAPRAS